MKIHSWKKIAAGLVVLGLAVTGIYYFSSRPDKNSIPLTINPAFAEFISSYTTGVIRSGSTVTIVLSADGVDSTDVGKEAPQQLFDFSPSLSGKAVWRDRRTVEFIPDTRLASGQIYRTRFFLSRVNGDVPEDLATFAFSFHVIPQNYEFAIVNTKPYRNTELERQKIEGVFQTADYAPAADIEKTIGAEQEGKGLNVSWSHTEDGRQHTFVVEEVARKEQAGKVSIRVDGNPIGIDRRQDVMVDVPALQEFKLMRTRVVQSPAQYVVLQFSDPVREDQNLQGLIRIGELTSLDFDIHDNEIWVYPAVRQSGMMTMSVEAGIRNVFDRRLQRAHTEQVTFEQVKPAVRFAGKGSILPTTDGLVLPFEAVNLTAVDVQIVKIHEKNVLQFFQVNNIESGNELRRVGNRVLRKRISLESTGIMDPGKWNRYTLDIARLVQAEPGAIYEVRLGFRKEYSSYGCESGSAAQPAQEEGFIPDEGLADDGFEGAWSYDYYDPYYYGDGFDWRERDNPCHISYYTSDRYATRNVLASDLALTVKRGEDSETVIFVTDIKTAQPLAGVEVTLYSFQLQDLASGATGKDGKVTLATGETPFAVVARNGSQRGYIRMVDGESLMVSSFDVAGQVVQKGLKGFLYGERGVWRPGDSLFLTFILEDRSKLLPENHPVVFELTDPRGQVIQRMVKSTSENGFYRFATATTSDAPTGNWQARVKVGGTTFTENVKIETVKPNRLKINLDFGADKFTSRQIDGTLQVNWLHGAPGRHLRAEFDVLLTRQDTRFPKFPDFNFDDPSRAFDSESQPVFEGVTNAEGEAQVSSTLEVAGAPSGLIHATFRGKVFEESGNFSVDRFTVPFYPYESFVGLRVPAGEQYSGILYTDTQHTIALATVDPDGRGISREGIQVSLHKLQWRWWWDNTSERLANFMEGSYESQVRSGTVNTINGKGEWSFRLEAAEYGRYFLRACDPASGHCAGQVVYVDEPGWYSRARANDARGGASLLSFATDKESYVVGEKIALTIPGTSQGRALVSIENGSRVLETHWVQTGPAENRVTLDVTPEMTPNAYIHVSLMQPHAQTQNDLPLRLYGITGIRVEDPGTRLEPVIDMPDVLVPGEPVVIRVSEKASRKMTYTLAVVDEGLLDLTRFGTPDAWQSFYAREALGVRTWDVFDYVMGAFGTGLERFISIGGDDALSPGEVDPLANRFKPVVRFFGPYTLEGGEQRISFVMPQYIGSVKTMVVAGNDGAYGKAERTSKVKKPLMVLATLPRVLGTSETVSLPVTLFSGETALSSVDVSVRTRGPVAVLGAGRKSTTLSRDSDQTIDFELAVRPEPGVATVEVVATSGSITSTDVIELQVRNPNLPVSRVQEALLEADQKREVVVTPFGMVGTNSAMLEVSSLPPINLASRMRYLLQYPHGCVEQVTSSAFPQLYVDHIKELTAAERKVVQANVEAAITQLPGFVQRDGGFGYWPGVSESSDSWGTSYAGHFLIEAEAKGYYVPAELLRKWKSFQRSRALEWRRNTKYVRADLVQAYRLYTLALAGSPEMGAMNRLREEDRLPSSAAWMLAAAYAVSGQREAAGELVNNLSQAVAPYREMGYTYGSAIRDKALILQTLVLLGEDTRAFELVKEISMVLGDEGYWLSTQETAMCLKAVGAFAAKHKRGELKFNYRIGEGKLVKATTGLPYAQVEVPVTDTGEQAVLLENTSQGVLFTRLVVTGTPARGEEEDAANELRLTANYADMGGNAIDPAVLVQGTEFVSEVTISHPGVRGVYENLALSQIFPSGWEINNLRLEGTEEVLATGAFRYQDIRDDRVFTYFNLAPGETRTFRVLLTAAYAGRYYLPGPSCEAMYDATVYARRKGKEISVVKEVAK